MNVFLFSNQELACLATVLDGELRRLEADDPDALTDPESYASRVKSLHRLVISTVPATEPPALPAALPEGLELRRLQAKALGYLITTENENINFNRDEDIPQVELELDALALLHRELQQQLCESPEKPNT